MKHRSSAEKRLDKSTIDIVKNTHSYNDSKSERMNPKAYERFKAKATDYGSKRKCSYGDKKRSCDPVCRFWESCIKGKHESEWKGEIENARCNTASKNNTDE